MNDDENTNNHHYEFIRFIRLTNLMNKLLNHHHITKYIFYLIIRETEPIYNQYSRPMHTPRVVHVRTHHVRIYLFTRACVLI